MRRSRRLKCWLLMLLLTLVVILAGCGNSPEPIESESNTTKEDAIPDNQIETEQTGNDQKETVIPSDQKESESPQPTGDMTIHFLDVGQGLSVLVQSNGENLVYDGGDRGESSFVVSYLQQQGVTDIKYLISSHYDEDHVAGLVGCINAFNVENAMYKTLKYTNPLLMA